MRNYGVTTTDIMQAIRENRNAFDYWTRKEFPNIAQNHTDNIRDLRIMLLSIRFPENTFPTFTFGDDFTPYVVTDNADDNADDNTTVSDADRNAIVDAIADTISEADKASELISA